MKTIISGQWWRSHQSLACKGSCILRFCVMSWKKWIRTQHRKLLEKAVGLVQRLITIQNFGHNWRRTDGIRVEYFPGLTTLQLVQEDQKFMNIMGELEQFQGRIIFMSMFNDIIWRVKDNEQGLQKDFQQDIGHSSDLDQKQSGILTTKDHKENGTESLNWWWSNSEKADTQLSEPRLHCPEELLKAKEVENYRYTSEPMVIRLKLFFAQSFLSISPVSTEQSQMCVRNAVLVKQEQGDRYLQSNLTHCSSQQTDW